MSVVLVTLGFLTVVFGVLFLAIVTRNQAVPTSQVIRYLALVSMIVLLGVLFVDSLGGALDLEQYGIPQYDGEEADQPNLLLGIILITSGTMVLIETVFKRCIPEISDPRSLNFILGVPSGIVGILMGMSWMVGFEPIITTVGPMLDGVYLSGFVILLYEGMITLTDGDSL